MSRLSSTASGTEKFAAASNPSSVTYSWNGVCAWSFSVPEAEIVTFSTLPFSIWTSAESVCPSGSLPPVSGRRSPTGVSAPSVSTLTP